LGKHAPSNRIHIGAIGTGRISRDHDMPGVWKYDEARIVAVCDLDAHRLEEGRQYVETYYAKKSGTRGSSVATYEDYRDLLASRDVDAVLISTPDHWHAKNAIDAVRAGKHVYLQKPTSLTVAEGRRMSDAVNASGKVLQIGSQQRSMEQFRVACELVRNGRIGQLKEIEIRLPGDPPGGNPEEMPVPRGFNYDAWLGQTPWIPYTLDRVHPQQGYDRPGWLRCEQFGAGMITGWGAHHFDIAHWAMDREYSGPLEIAGRAEFPAPGSGLWDVHGYYETEMLYDNGVTVRGTTESAEKPNGVLFTGTEGWLFVSRGAYAASPNEPVSTKSEALRASDPKILSPFGPDSLRLQVSVDHHGDWLESIRTGKKNITPAEVAHRSCTACLLQHIAMKLNRRLYWDPVSERFRNDDEANALLSRPHRPPYHF
jgi:predicted dehydrogenase